ncbi:unnamed protein product [Linum tenue]|uniref:IST1-like protein n=1 Tax=Linum tenue TaxID=586396 RepID=A0AAV0IFJ0_9ROSI|nr:unnamed protein product [Linum tenue]
MLPRGFFLRSTTAPRRYILIPPSVSFPKSLFSFLPIEDPNPLPRFLITIAGRTMSMLDAFFSNKGFKAAKCKTLLKLTIPRIKLLRNRREIQIRQMRRDIAKLLENGQEATARIRVEHIIREENMMAAQEVLELFCELIAVRLPIIEAQRECPLDLKEAISTVCFAAPRCADLPELLQAQMLFASKYGKDFVTAATELMPDCGVNRQIVELLSVRAPSVDKKLKLLKEIAEEHELVWDPAGSEAELSKPHEDLLNGPAQFVSESKLPPPDEKHDEALSSNSVGATYEQPDTDSSADELDFPEVPKVVLRPNAAPAASAPDMTLPTEPTLHTESMDRDMSSDSLLHGSHSKHELIFEELPKESKNQFLDYSEDASQEKQFLPFITPPQTSYASAPARQYSSPPSTSNPKNMSDIDLHDILVSAQAAADSAERAAAAARSAATIAQAKIKELAKVNSDKSLDLESDNPFNTELHDQSAALGNLNLDHQRSSLDLNGAVFDSPRDHRDSPGPQLQRITSIDEDPYFSYPNLFGNHSSSHGSPSAQFVSDSSRSPH